MESYKQQGYRQTAHPLAQKLIKQSANPAEMYGVAVTGLSGELLTQVRRTAACGTPPFANGRSFDITLQLANLDPGPDATGASLVRWCQEILRTTLHAALVQTRGQAPARACSLTISGPAVHL